MYISRGGPVSGGQRQLLYLIENLDRSVYEPIVACNKGGELAEALKRLSVEVMVRNLHPWRKLRTLILRFIDTRQLYKYAGHKNISLVHCCDVWMNGYMRYIAGRLGIPSVLHVRKPVTPRDVYKYDCNSADKVIAISTRITDNLLTAGVPAEKVVRIDDSVDVELFSPEKNTKNVLREKFGADNDILIGLIGRIEAFKRQLDFLNAAKEVLKHTRRSVTFFLVGEVNSRACFRKIQKFIRENSMQGRVRCTGRLNNIAEVISSLDILVSLSGGSVMFEAMAAGKAVISAGFTPKKYSYHIQDGQTGLLVESQEPADLAQAMSKLVDTPQLRKQLGTQARQWAIKELTHKKMVEKTQQLYDSLLKSEETDKNQNDKKSGN